MHGQRRSWCGMLTARLARASKQGSTRKTVFVKLTIHTLYCKDGGRLRDRLVRR